MISAIQQLKRHFAKILETKHSPKAIATGFALGTFIAILPTPGVSYAIGLLVILLFPKISKYALIGGLIFWNPIMQIPIYAASYKIGDVLFGQAPIVAYNIPLSSNVVNFTRRFLVGNIILAFIIAPVCYFIMYTITKRIVKN